jgi:predicted O-methyltransferase YrrM
MTDSTLDRAWRSAAFRLQRYAASASRHVLDRQLEKLSLQGVRGIHTWTSAAELEALYRLAASAPPGANIVELGSYLGASTCYLAAGAALVGGHVTAIDLWNNETIAGGKRDTFADFQRHTAGAAHLITTVRKRTQDLTPADVRPPVHLGFIDADHSYEATKADAAFLAPLIAPSGVVAFHDTTVFAGVGRALAELLLTGDWCIYGQAENLTCIRRATWSPWPPDGSRATGSGK